MFISQSRAVASSLLLTVGLFLIVQLWPGGIGIAHPEFGGNGTFTQEEFEGAPYLLYVPSTVPSDRPATVLIALHGMGAQPDNFASGLIATANENGWVMVVPHLPYGDWTQTDQLRAEEKKMMSWLNDLLGALPGETGLSLNDRALLYGFSRGGQLAHRFALGYPHRVLAAAIMSPGTYTLPVGRGAAYDNPSPLNFPVGVNDIGSVCGHSFDPAAVKDIPFWIGVGEKDNVPGDVPRQWDQYQGKTRVERAQAFAASLRDLGASAELNVFPGLGHAESVDSRASAMAFLSAHAEQLETPPDATSAAASDSEPTEITSDPSAQ